MDTESKIVLPMVTIRVNGRDIEVPEDEVLLKVLLSADVRLPALCYHPALKSATGVCRLCTVEISLPGKAPEAKRACLVKTAPGLAVQTESVAVQVAREKAMRALLKQAPQSERLIRLAGDFGIHIDPAPDGCIRCLLCERVCKEVVGAAALKLEKRDGLRLIAPVEGRCIGCGTCANICPTQVIHIKDDENVRTISIRDEVIGRHPLETCDRLRTALCHAEVSGGRPRARSRPPPGRERAPPPLPGVRQAAFAASVRNPHPQGTRTAPIKR